MKKALKDLLLFVAIDMVVFGLVDGLALIQWYFGDSWEDARIDTMLGCFVILTYWALSSALKNPGAKEKPDGEEE